MLRKFELFVIILLIIWISSFPEPIQGQYHIAVKTFLGLAFLILLIRKRGRIFKPIDFPLWIFLVAIGINVLFAQQKDIALRSYIDLAIPMFLIYYLVSESISSRERFNLLARIICISSILVALLAIIESIFAVNPLYEYFLENPYYRRYMTGFVRPMSTQFNPAVLGSYLLGCLPFNFLLFKQSRGFFRLLGGGGIVLNITVIILTFSRGVFLGMIAMIMFYLFAQKKKLLIAIFSIILLILILIWSFLPYPFCRFGINFMIKDKDMKGSGIFSNYRFDRLIMTQHIFKDHPLVGLGFQHFRIRFYEYYPRKGIIPYEFMIADNMYLTILTETGIIGFSGFLIFIFYFFRKAWRQQRLIAYMSQRRLQLLLILSAFAGLLVNMGAYELFYWPNQYLLFCIIIGCLGAFRRDREKYDY